MNCTDSTEEQIEKVQMVGSEEKTVDLKVSIIQ